MPTSQYARERALGRTPVAPVAGFSGSPLFLALVPASVTFADASTGTVTEWLWDFGDGQQGTEQNPVHQYTVSGPFTVSLTATGPGGTDTVTKTNYITTG